MDLSGRRAVLANVCTLNYTDEIYHQTNYKMLQTRIKVDGEVVNRCSVEADHDELWR
jgi:hypothetical protein